MREYKIETGPLNPEDADILDVHCSFVDYGRFDVDMYLISEATVMSKSSSGKCKMKTNRGDGSIILCQKRHDKADDRRRLE